MKNNENLNLAILKNDVNYIKNEIVHINKKLDEKYVRREEFEPVKKIIYALIGILIISIVGGAIGLLFTN